ncbi:hypothetical protein [Sporosarcina sp. FSL W7-1283]|uniref:hypothetical protein n=1 Tax=Sporosarcina sp. FSL W7-1283 TaxID=2921560 RepID=UPI0030F81C72
MKCYEHDENGKLIARVNILHEKEIVLNPLPPEEVIKIIKLAVDIDKKDSR